MLISLLLPLSHQKMQILIGINDQYNINSSPREAVMKFTVIGFQRSEKGVKFPFDLDDQGNLCGSKSVT